MGKEIERKFLVIDDSYRTLVKGILYQQGFLNTSRERVVRVRIIGADAFLTMKGISQGAIRTEFEYPIPVEDAKVMLEEMCEKPIIKKYRYIIKLGELVWEVDEFLEENEGLVIAEVELQHETQKLIIPEWIGEEVTHDSRYFNANLIANPYKSWN